MRNLMLFLIVFVSAGTMCEAQSTENILLNKPMPEISGVTLDGKKIDRKYFKNKVTLVNFMFIGCLPCMKEIAVLNQIHSDNKTNPKFQVLGIAANTSNQLLHFNAEDTTIYSQIRRQVKTDPVAYDLLAGCEKERAKAANSLGGEECKDLSEKFYFSGYPITFLIDKKGVVRKIFEGFPMSTKDGYSVGEDGKVTFGGAAEVSAEFENKLQGEIDRLLNE